MGRFNEAIVEIEEARKLASGATGGDAPLQSRTVQVSRVNAAASEIYYWARRYDQSIELIRPTVEAEP